MITYPNRLQEIREKLNGLIESDADVKDILALSVELDTLIEIFMQQPENEE